MSDNVISFPCINETTPFDPGLVHDLFVNIEEMTPAEIKNGGKNLIVNYSFSESLFGDILIASSQKGICYLAFIDDDTTAFNQMKKHFPNACFTLAVDSFQQNADLFFQMNKENIRPVKLHLKGSPFQFKVWQTLLKIPFGQLISYREIAGMINMPKGARAVGTAIGCNPVAFIIPCHRVIQTSGGIGGYRWGIERKMAIINWEQSETYSEINGQSDSQGRQASISEFRSANK